MKLRHLFLSCVAAAFSLTAIAATTSLPRSTPEAEGISSNAILEFIQAADASVDTIHSFMLVRHGKVVSEAWWTPYDAKTPHTFFSLSKSFTSTAVGLAVQEGLLSIDDPVIKFFPDELPAEPSQNLKAMRVRDLLTMTTGHHDEDIATFPFNSQESLAKKFLELPVAHKPGTFFVYNTPATYMQSAIVQKVTGQSVLEYLRPRLFDPLGIENPQWQADAHGISLGGFGLSGRTEDIAKFGQLYLQKGKWQGKQLVPATWVELATARHVSNGSNPESDWEQGYGFQFWRSRHGFYRGDGAFGQFCLVLEEFDAVVAITSGTRDMGHVMNLVWEKLVPAMKPKALRADKTAHEKLTRAAATLTIPLPASNGSQPTDAVIAQFGRTYRFEANEQQIESVSIAKGSDAGSHVVRFQMAGRTNEFVGGDAWRRSRQAVSHQPEQDVATAGAWTADDTFTLKLCLVETPFIVTMKLRFDGDTVSLDSEYNVGFGDPKRPTLTGRAE